VVEAIRQSSVKMVLVVDEYGHFEGIVTFGDVLEVITGVYNEEPGDDPAIVERQDGSWLVAGWMPVDDFSERFKISVPKDARYETVAGYILAALNRLPRTGESFDRDNWHFEVIDLDGRRIDKVLISPLLPSEGA
jgi:putative hemolysin